MLRSSGQHTHAKEESVRRGKRRGVGGREGEGGGEGGREEEGRWHACELYSVASACAVDYSEGCGYGG